MLTCEKPREDTTQASGESSSGATAQRSRQTERRSKPNEKIKSQGEDATETEKRDWKCLQSPIKSNCLADAASPRPQLLSHPLRTWHLF